MCRTVPPPPLSASTLPLSVPTTMLPTLRGRGEQRSVGTTSSSAKSGLGEFVTADWHP